MPQCARRTAERGSDGDETAGRRGRLAFFSSSSFCIGRPAGLPRRRSERPLSPYFAVDSKDAAPGFSPPLDAGRRLRQPASWPTSRDARRTRTTASSPSTRRTSSPARRARRSMPGVRIGDEVVAAKIASASVRQFEAAKSRGASSSSSAGRTLHDAVANLRRDDLVADLTLRPWIAARVDRGRRRRVMGTTPSFAYVCVT